MIFHETDISRLHLIELEPHRDTRGFFMRTFCEEEFRNRGLNTHWPQCNLSHSDRCGTLRGLHFQKPPVPDSKLIRVSQGAIFSVVVDLRNGTDTPGRKWYRTISASDRMMLHIPEGCAFGFQTLADHTELHYQMSVPYHEDLAGGVCWDDPDIAIEWPLKPVCLSDRDRGLPLLRDAVRSVAMEPSAH